VTVRVAVPGFRMVIVWVPVAATLILPKLRLDGVTEICGWMPVPLRAIVAGELVAVLTTVTLPEREPAEVGAKLTLNDADWPAARLSGSVIPLELKPVPVALICEIETLEFPVLEIVTFCAAVDPVARLPKLNDAGETESWSVLTMPVPASGIASEEFGALLMSVMLPEKAAAELGAKPTANEVDPPGGMDSGNVNPVELNPVPTREACVKLSAAVPGFRMVTVWVAVADTLTLPKLTLDGVTEICGCTPAPPREIVAGELVAVLTTLILPAALPATEGAKITLSGRLWPAARVAPAEKPVTVNPAPVMFTCEIVTLPVPVLVNVTGDEAELPTKVFPKLRLLVLDESK